MKILIVALSLISLTVLSKPVDGKIVYKLPSGDLVERQVVLEVPSRGQGEVILSGNSFSWKTTDFSSYQFLGKEIFVASFDTDFQDMKSTLVFRGSYLKGNNKLIYAGDIYKKKEKQLKYIGLFNFSYDR